MKATLKLSNLEERNLIHTQIDKVNILGVLQAYKNQANLRKENAV